MSILYIISQVLIFIGTAIDLAARLMKSKKLILILMVISSCFSVASYIFISYPLPAIINAINLARSIYYVYLNEKDKPLKSYIVPIVLTVITTCISVACLWTNAYDLFMIASLSILAIGFSFKNLLEIRIITIVNAAMWLFYNILLGAYVGALCNVLNIILAIVGIILYDIIAPRKQKKQVELAKLSEPIEDIEYIPQENEK